MTIQYNKVIPNTFGMKVKAAVFASFGSAEELRTILSDMTLPRPLLLVGAGSNFLFTRDFPGTVLHSEMRDIRILGEGRGEERCGRGAFGGASREGGAVPSPAGAASGEVLVEAEAGAVFDDFCEWASSRGLWGVENLSHIPGEVGAGAVQNVGAYGVEAKDVIVRVNCLDLESLESVSFENSECGYGYRASNFKGIWKGRYAVLSVVFRLGRTPAPKLDYGGLRAAVEAENSPLTPSLLRRVVTEIRKKKLPEPSETGSAGSFFKNPVVPMEHYERILSRHREENGADATVPHYIVEQPGGAPPKVKIPAAWMIEQCGWKGRTEGGAACYSRQPLVLVNLSGDASPEDVVLLKDKIITSVKDRYGVQLSPEAEII